LVGKTPIVEGDRVNAGTQTYSRRNGDEGSKLKATEMEITGS